MFVKVKLKKKKKNNHLYFRQQIKKNLQLIFLVSLLNKTNNKLYLNNKNKNNPKQVQCFKIKMIKLYFKIKRKLQCLEINHKNHKLNNLFYQCHKHKIRHRHKHRFKINNRHK